MSFDLQHVSIHGHDIGYRMAGEGPALLMIHGIAGSSRAWREVMPTLAHDYTCGCRKRHPDRPPGLSLG
jgi:pimeloyl-ACP methyl ester carboxylesterase